MLKIIKLSLLCFTSVVLHGCATIEYYEFLEPKRSTSQQFIDAPYVYSGRVEINQESHHYQFSGVLHDGTDKFLDIDIPTNIAIKEHPMFSSSLDAKLGHNMVELSNSDHQRVLGEPALLVVNPNYPFDVDTIKAQPSAFSEEYYLQYQAQSVSENELKEPSAPSRCPHILLLNIDIYEELPTTLEIAQCSIEQSGEKAGEYSYVWQTINPDKILNTVEHDKPFGYQVAYLGLLFTVPFDAIVAPIYTLGWGIVSSKNLLFSGEE